MRCNRLVTTAIVLASGFALSACETSNFSDKLQDTIADMNVFGTSKKPLPGERKEVFPNGVPGVTQGVPAELVKGNQAAVDPEPAPAPQAAPPPAKKKKVAVVKKKPARQASRPPSAAPAADDGVWPPPPSSAPPPADSVWPAPPQ